MLGTQGCLYAKYVKKRILTEMLKRNIGKNKISSTFDEA